ARGDRPFDRCPRGDRDRAVVLDVLRRPAWRLVRAHHPGRGHRGRRPVGARAGELPRGAAGPIGCANPGRAGPPERVGMTAVWMRVRGEIGLRWRALVGLGLLAGLLGGVVMAAAAGARRTD